MHNCSSEGEYFVLPTVDQLVPFEAAKQEVGTRVDRLPDFGGIMHNCSSEGEYFVLPTVDQLVPFEAAQAARPALAADRPTPAR